MPNLCTLLSEIPERAKDFSVIDLKDAFYSVPLVEESQFLFAFEGPTQPASQLTWTVLPQGFHDSPHLFGQSLSRDLQNFNSSEAMVLQYVDARRPYQHRRSRSGCWYEGLTPVEVPNSE